VLARPDHRVRPAADLQFAQDVLDVRLDCAHAVQLAVRWSTDANSARA
jgi:hypothetical protein